MADAIPRPSARPASRIDVVPRAASIALGLLCCVGSFGLVSTALRALTPLPNAFGLGPKVAHFRAHRDEYDLLFVGSSLTRHGIIPEQLDAELARRGIAVHSFNLGIAGMSMFELDYWFERLLAERPARLRWVVIEVGYWEPMRPGHRQFGTERSVLWHSWDVTRDVLASLWQRPVPAGARLHLWDVALSHVELMGKRYTNLGRGLGPLRRWAGREPASHPGDVSPQEVAAGRGYLLPPDAPPGSFGDVAEYRRLRAEVAEGRVRQWIPPLGPDVLCRLAEHLRALGVQPIFMLAPTVVRGRHPLGAARAQHAADAWPCVEHLLDYQQPDRYPELFDEAVRFDFDHLAHDGAVQLTALVAGDLAEILGGE